MNAEFSTAQAVTPGQGQSVRVSGVQIGEIGGVTLKNGMADVQMQIDDQYKHLIHTDATALLRPKTGLKDMFIEIDPGSKSAPVAKPGCTIPVANTNPDIDVDEILASLDGDTRQYLQLLVNGAGQGLKGQGGVELAQVFERFEPTHRDLARLNKAVAVRGHDLRQLVNSLQRLNTALATKQGQIVQLVDSSAKVFHAFASEDGNISRALGRPAGHALRRPPRRCRRCQPSPSCSARRRPTCCPPRARSRPPTPRWPRWPSRARRSSRTRSGRSWSPRGRWSASSSRPRSTWPRPRRA